MSSPEAEEEEESKNPFFLKNDFNETQDEKKETEELLNFDYLGTKNRKVIMLDQ